MSLGIKLRPVAAGDASAFIAAARRSRCLHANWVKPPRTDAQFGAYLERFVPPLSHGFVACRADGELVGALNITNAVYGAFRSAYLGYYAFAGHEQQGCMTQALRLLVRHAFTQLKLHRLEANIQPGNRASIALARRCGFVCEGYSRNYLKIGGRWCDHERWAIVRD